MGVLLFNFVFSWVIGVPLLLFFLLSDGGTFTFFVCWVRVLLSHKSSTE
jgi:hypothetical protein